MRRHPAFQDLSRDHFVALNHVVKARRVADEDRFAEPLADVWQGFLRLWRELEPHFDEEEENLQDVLEERRPEMAARLADEHGRLRAAFAAIGARHEPDVGMLWNTAEALRVHVRWEEEHLFEALQEALSSDELEQLAARSRQWRLARRGPASVGTGRPV